MKIAMFSAKKYDEEFFNQFNLSRHEITYLSTRLNKDTAVLASGFDAVCCFVNDNLNEEALSQLNSLGFKLVILRCAGFNNVNLDAAEQLGICVCRVPEYSPHAVAEHAVALMMDLNRNIHRAHNRVRENDYSLDGLMGFDLYKKCVGVIGAGKIGRAFIDIMRGFGCKVLVYDPYPPADLERSEVTLVSLDDLLQQSDVISLHCPLNNHTHHLINQSTIAKMKPGVMIINTSRGGLIDTAAVIKYLKSKHIGYLGIDVYEEEADIFFEDLSNTAIDDDIFARLQTFPHVTITGHQGFFTREALSKIASVSLENASLFEQGRLEEMHVVTPN